MSNQRTTGSNYSNRMDRDAKARNVIYTESLLTDDHRRICKQFGCGKEVKHLHSEYCVDHPAPKIDVTKIIKL